MGVGGTLQRKEKWVAWSKGGVTRKTHKSDFMETLTDWNMNLTKRMKVKKWKDLAWFVGELKQGINFSCDILREDKVNIKRARTEKVTETEDEATRALLREQIITDIFV